MRFEPPKNCNYEEQDHGPEELQLVCQTIDILVVVFNL